MSAKAVEVALSPVPVRLSGVEVPHAPLPGTGIDVHVRGGLGPHHLPIGVFMTETRRLYLLRQVLHVRRRPHGGSRRVGDELAQRDAAGGAYPPALRRAVHLAAGNRAPDQLDAMRCALELAAKAFEEAFDVAHFDVVPAELDAQTLHIG